MISPNSGDYQATMQRSAQNGNTLDSIDACAMLAKPEPPAPAALQVRTHPASGGLHRWRETTCFHRSASASRFRYSLLAISYSLITKGDHLTMSQAWPTWH